MFPLGDIVTYEKISSSSQRGRHKLIESTGYSYTLKRKTKAGVHWQCVVRNKMICLATIKEVGNSFTRGHAEHNHPPETCSTIKSRVSTLVKQKAMEDIFRPASVVVEEVLREHVNPNNPITSLPA